MTAEEALSNFKSGELAINIYGASAEDMKLIQSITGLRWLSHKDLDCPNNIVYAFTYSYLHNFCGAKDADCLTVTFVEPHNVLTVNEFLALFMNNIEENEFERMFGE